MLKKLKKIYPSLIPFDKNKKNYLWFMTDSNEVFGIQQNELSAKDLLLLETVFETYEPHLPQKSPAEELWHDRIFGENKKPPAYPFRFIYFSISKKQISAAEFKDAFVTLFDRPIPILWENDSEGILIEEIRDAEEQIHFEQIINILMADLSVNIHFFINSIIQHTDSPKGEFNHTMTLGKKIFNISNQNIIHYIEAIPYLLLDELAVDTRENLSKSILKQFYNDREMLETLDNYFKYNLNISETAKNMYMHRNSLQYRMDKFTKETGFNIQKFNEAISVRLAILARSST